MPRPKAMHAADPPWLEGLNPPQREAATALDGPVLVLAGAGTGKTRALTARLAHILAERRAWPSQILAVTFTNKAAREMRARLRALIGPEAETMPYLGTFHATAARMLRRHAELVGLSPSFAILDPDDLERLARRVIDEAKLDERRWPARQLCALIDRWKNRGLGPEEVPEAEAQAFAHGRGAELYGRLQAELRQLNACDFGDLLLHLIAILRRHDDVRARWQAQFRYLLVDEFQDTNAAQYLWLRLLAAPAFGGHGQVACVGDDDQSIYSWRGAEIGNMLGFARDFPGARLIRLEQNYRSTGHILGAASALIAANRHRLGKTLWTEAGAGEPVEVVTVWDGEEEAHAVAQRIERLEREGTSLAEVAILVRAQFQTRAFEECFLRLGLPYRIVGGVRFYERAEIRDALAYLRTVVRPDDSLAFERIVNTPRRGLGEKSIARIRAFARQAGLALPAAAERIAETDELGATARRGLRDLIGKIGEWRAALPTTEPAALLDTILDGSGYRAMLSADRSAEAEGRLENLRELVRAVEEFPDLGSFLDHVALVMDNEREDGRARVTLMTLHAAKGLEFDHVFLAGWEEGLFPSLRALEEGGEAALEEERRLAYVGLTRARRRATILSAASRRIHGQWTSALPSRFLDELPDAHVHRTTTMTGGPSLWRAAVGRADDPFAHLAQAGGRGPGVVRAARHPGGPTRLDGLAAARTLPANPAIGVGARVFHDKFGMGTVRARDASKLEVEFDHAGIRMVMDGFVQPMP
ncbi:MAG: UvrD-helicase domain-containing protein [Sphingomonadaceae bacterium]|uniref:ATP-dependent helicase n=1 Tax=Thermaurantiacus sp. TaxID=2820283 RepID=UPI00298ED5CD|nr:UvrD-helicase domain-containing protein [Thermaurantiacus sp.]MCS6987628.1 UvrD-helicase domain-containing protein [Sphingomonadaceae bacterium]MDW8415229.1 UvrD-helicase domain-containing protein [Thermaurantiacus sp.]